MLNKKELEKQGPPGFTLGQKEKDYVQHWILTYVSRAGFPLIFRGGTCLQKAFGLPRYSEDLDFIVREGEADISGISGFLSSGGFGEVTLKKKENVTSTVYKARVQGPLYSGKILSETSVTLDLSKREANVLDPVIAAINPLYGDLLPYQISCMDRNEIAAEKIRAIYTRESARDLYDLYFLVRQNALPKVELVNGKLGVRNLVFERAQFEEKIARLEKEWNKEITFLTPQFIEFKLVAETVKKETRKLLG